MKNYEIVRCSKCIFETHQKKSIDNCNNVYKSKISGFQILFCVENKYCPMTGKTAFETSWCDIHQKRHKEKKGNGDLHMIVWSNVLHLETCVTFGTYCSAKARYQCLTMTKKCCEHEKWNLTGLVNLNPRIMLTNLVFLEQKAY